MIRLAGLLAALAVPAAAEGARQAFDCAVVSACDAAGQCGPAPEGQAVSFEIEPVSVGPEGAGDYTITQGGGTFPMTNVTGLGPLVWSEGPGDRQVLVYNSDSTLVWHRFSGGDRTSSLAYLACEVTQ